MTPPADLVSLEYERHKAEVIRTVAGKLSASGVTLADGDLDASYNEAWHALYLAMADGEEIENRVGYLVTVTHRRALNEFRALKASRRADVDLDLVGTELDLDAKLDAEIQLRQVREGFRSSLSARELEAATLTHLYGYTRPEAAEAMGIRPKRMEKIMDRASRKISSVVETVRAGEHCEEMASTVRAFALGLLDPDGERYGLACDHLDGCPACRREVWTERGLAAIGPPLPVAFALLAGGAGAGGGAIGGYFLKGPGGTARKTAVAGGAATAVVAVVVAVALVTGVIGGDGGSQPASSDKVAVGGSAGPEAHTPATQASQQDRAAARRARIRAKKRREAKRRRARAAAAEQAAAAQASEPTYVPQETYVPPPVPEAVPEAAPVDPPQPEPSPTPKPRPDPEPVKPTTDAGEEFGLR